VKLRVKAATATASGNPTSGTVRPKSFRAPWSRFHLFVSVYYICIYYVRANFADRPSGSCQPGEHGKGKGELGREINEGGDANGLRRTCARRGGGHLQDEWS
jgi:hypothetical protein